MRVVGNLDEIWTVGPSARGFSALLSRLCGAAKSLRGKGMEPFIPSMTLPCPVTGSARGSGLRLAGLTPGTRPEASPILHAARDIATGIDGFRSLWDKAAFRESVRGSGPHADDSGCDVWPLLACWRLSVQQACRHGYEYVLPVRAVEVVPGALYRGAWQHDIPMRGLVREHHIKTIVALAHPEGHHMAIAERKLARDLGVDWVHVPIIDDPKIGHGKTVTELLDQAADLLADPDRRPIYFHCHHGLIRTSMAQMAWRMKHCGWTLERAERGSLAIFRAGIAAQGRRPPPRGGVLRGAGEAARRCRQRDRHQWSIVNPSASQRGSMILRNRDASTG